MLCGQEDSVIEDEIPMPSVPEDPTVQESFECMVASQLEEGLPHDLLWEEDSEDEVVLMSPAALLQSRSNNRLQSLSASPLPKPRKTFRAGSLVHLGTYDPVVDTMSLSPPPKCPDSSQGVSQTPCRCKRGLKAPGENAKKWPQSPLLFRPTPGTDTKVIGIRYAGSKDYLWENGDKHTWTQRLNEDWGRSIERNIRDCNECMVLPINNGNEQRGKSLVVDFRTNVFEGTILLRLRHSNGTTPEPYDDSKGYFEGMNRRYQVVIQGKPLREIPLTECMAGSRLDRPAGKLPPKWILKGAIKVLSFFAPQMSVEIDSDRPNYLTPLGSTPQVLRVNGDLDMEEPQEEPTVAEESILGVATEGNTSLARARLRKKLFDKMFVKKDKEPVLSVNNVYTFEFLQHLFNFTKFTMELGSMLGSVDLSNLLNGQPMQIMAETGDGSKLWSFDIWHESLIAKASEHDKLL
uniref:Domain of unknown function at the cortex 1 domain-containing protein n=1 Tax=Cyclophora tenuis TaxID=216820 RepID=A0A7S1GSE0_CYCTE